MAFTLTAVGCGASETTSVTAASSQPPTTPSSTTGIPTTAAISTTTTTTRTTTTTAPFTVEPIEDDWTLAEITWGVQAGCCELPALGPVSPEGPIPAQGWPADGFYDVTATRMGDPPGVLALAIRRWVPCADLPNRCIHDAPKESIVADPASEVARTLIMDEELTIVIRPIQRFEDGRQTSIGLTGTGRALQRLLSGFCAGYLPPQNTTNCGIDHAFIDWVWDPYQDGRSIDEIEQQIVAHGTDPAFPLGMFDDGSSAIPCSADRRCPIAYRGPHGAHLVIDPGLVEWVEGFPGSVLYGWWTSLEIRKGRPILYIDAGQIAG